MPRATTSSDVFNAIAEPRRRAILDVLAGDERSVSYVVHSLGVAQPSISKHLRVLRDAGVVRARRDGRQILYRTDVHAIKPVYEWASKFERFWSRRLRRIKERAESSQSAARHDIVESRKPRHRDR